MVHFRYTFLISTLHSMLMAFWLLHLTFPLQAKSPYKTLYHFASSPFRRNSTLLPHDVCGSSSDMRLLTAPPVWVWPIRRLEDRLRIADYVCGTWARCTSACSCSPSPHAHQPLPWPCNRESHTEPASTANARQMFSTCSTMPQNDCCCSYL